MQKSNVPLFSCIVSKFYNSLLKDNQILNSLRLYLSKIPTFSRLNPKIKKNSHLYLIKSGNSSGNKSENFR